MTDYRAFLRRRLLEEMYDRLSPDDRRLFVQMTMQGRSADDIMQAISQQNAKIDEVSRKIGDHPFATDLLSNILGNGITDGLILLGKALLKRL